MITNFYGMTVFHLYLYFSLRSAFLSFFEDLLDFTWGFSISMSPNIVNVASPVRCLAAIVLLFLLLFSGNGGGQSILWHIGSCRRSCLTRGFDLTMHSLQGLALSHVRQSSINAGVAGGETGGTGSSRGSRECSYQNEKG